MRPKLALYVHELFGIIRTRLQPVRNAQCTLRIIQGVGYSRFLRDRQQGKKFPVHVPRISEIETTIDRAVFGQDYLQLNVLR